MNFNKIAQDMIALQEKLEVYEVRNSKVKDLLTFLVKEYSKLEKKYNKEMNEIQKNLLHLEMLYTKKMIHYIEDIYKEASEELGKKTGEQK